MKIQASRKALVGIVVALIWLVPDRIGAQDDAWTKTSPANITSITGVAMSPADPHTLYATTDAGDQVNAGIWKSLDGGKSWSALTPGKFEFMSCLAVDPSDPKRVYAGSTEGLVAVSSDGGTKWSTWVIGKTPVSSIVSDGGNIYAATRSSGYYWGNTYSTPVVSHSTDGKTWTSAGLTGARSVYALLADAVGKHILAGTDYAYFAGYYGALTPKGGGVAIGEGFAWESPSSDVGLAVTALAQSSQGGSVLGATASGQILRSEDEKKWAPLGSLPGTVSALVVDPASETTVYAGLQYGGVYRSIDGGMTWHLFDFGLTNGSVRALAVDPTGRILYAGTGAGIFRRDLPAAQTGTCQAAEDHLCLLGSRFRVDLYAIDPNTQARASVKAFSNGDGAGYFSVPSLTGDATLPEVMVKMLDATALPGQGYWAFSAALTNIRYSVVVTDTTTGRLQIYDGQSFCGVADAPAFSADGYATAAAATLRAAQLPEVSTGELQLLSGRFRLTLTATDPRTGGPVAGVANSMGDRFGYFSLPDLTGDAAYPEVLVKMIDARGMPDQDFWLFQGPLTSLPYALNVRDTVTGASKTYRNDPADPTRICGSVDSRVTTGPIPSTLGGYWLGSAFDLGGIPAMAAHTGDRLHVSWVGTASAIFIDGSLSTGHLTGTIRLQYDACQFEGDASGVAISTHIQVIAENLTGPCGAWGSLQIDLLPRNY
jgi:photosystem II stability/assembly factor-like uncharacterized protein